MSISFFASAFVSYICFQFLHGFQAFVEPSFFHALSGIEGDQLRDLVAERVRISHRAAGVADRGACGHGSEGDDARDVVLAVFFAGVGEHFAAPGVREVDIDIRHLDAFRIEEALEEQTVPDRVDIGDVEHIGHERSRRRAAARSDRDAVRFRPPDEVLHDKEVVGESRLFDHADLIFEPFAHFLLFRFG